MMSMIAGEETNLEEREVTMTVREREKTDAEMIGMRGKKAVSHRQHSSQSCSFHHDGTKQHFIG